MRQVAVALLLTVAAATVRADEVLPSLADRAIAFMASRPGGNHRARREARWFRELAAIVEEATDTEQPPSAELVLAVSFRESSWKPMVQGALGEHGLLQLHPDWVTNMGLRSGENPLDPRVNLRLGVGWMRTCFVECGGVGRGLVRYATGQCGPPTWRERLVMRWEERIKNGG